MKKMLLVVATFLLVCAMGVSAFAHGGNHRNGHRSAARSDYAVCTVEGCIEPGLHEHSGEYYYCRTHTSGQGCGGHRNCL